MGEGLRGKPQSQVDPVFSERLAQLRADCQRQLDGLRGDAQRRWCNTASPAGSPLPLDPADIAGLHRPHFDRTGLNTTYAQVVRSFEDAGTVAETIAIKLQLDYLAAEERAWRVRHSSLPRALCHAHGRRAAQADRGRVFRAVELAVAEILAAGGAS